MLKFVIVDHSITDNSGHYLEYARNVLSATMESGYEPWLMTNKQFNIEICDFNVRAIYKYDVWGKARFDKYVEPSNFNQGCNEANKNQSYCGEQIKGLLKFFLKPIYNKFKQRVVRKSFYESTIAVLDIVNPQEGDIIFIPTLSTNDIIAIHKVMNKDVRAQRCTWHLLSRRNIFADSTEKGKRTDNQITNLKKTLKKISRHENVYFYTDTEQLTEQYNQLKYVHYKTLPIPINMRIVPNICKDIAVTNIISLGDARFEKGFQYLPDVVEKLYQKNIEGNLIKFYIQANFTFDKVEGNEILIKAREKLKRYKNRVFVLETALNTDEYTEILKKANIGIFLYDRKEYSIRSSGIFAECIAAGIPVIVPNGTWMSQQINKLKSTEVGVCYNDVLEVSSRVEYILRNYQKLSEATIKFSEDWRKFHSGQNLLNTILNNMKGENDETDTQKNIL